MKPGTLRSYGFTLIETLVSIAVFTVIIVAISDFEANVFQYRNSSYNSLTSATDAENVLKVMVKELRSAEPSAAGSYPIVTAATSTLSFYSDVNSNGIADQVTFFISSTTLEQGVIMPTGSPLTYNSANQTNKILINNVKNSTSSPIFQYYDDSYTGTSSPLVQPVTTSAVRLVRINLTVDADPSHSPLPITYVSDATLRNLKDNL